MVKYYVEDNQAWEADEYECPRCGKVTHGEDLPFNDFSDDGLEYYECSCGKRILCVTKSQATRAVGNDRIKSLSKSEPNDIFGSAPILRAAKTAPNFIFGSSLEEHHCHLGWEFFVFKKSDTDAKGSSYRHGLRFLASWECGLGGEKWIEDLVASGQASPQHQGFMSTYVVTAEVINDVLRNGIPKHAGPDVVGDDYFIPGGWVGNALIDWKALGALNPGEILVVDMFDQS